MSKVGGTHHFQMFERRQYGLQFADGRHYLVAGQGLAAVQQVHHLVLETLHRTGVDHGQRTTMRPRCLREIDAEIARSGDYDAKTPTKPYWYWRAAYDRRYPKWTAVQPVARLVKWRTRFGVGTTLCVPVLLYVPNARAARRVDGRVRRFSLLPPPRARAKHPNWWGPGNTDTFPIVFGAGKPRHSEPVGISYRPSSSSRLQAAASAVILLCD